MARRRKKVEAAEALKITAPDLLRLGVIDEIVNEPVGGAHTDPAQAAALLDIALERALPRSAHGRRQPASTRATRSSARWARSASRRLT